MLLRLLAGMALAVGVALPFMTSAIAGIATWKIVLGLAGAGLFIAGSRTAA